MKHKSENILIVLLIVAASFLGSIFISTYSADKAYAGDSGVRLGNYKMLTAPITNAQDLLYIVDNDNQLVSTYFINCVQSKIKLIKCQSLKRLLK